LIASDTVRVDSLLAQVVRKTRKGAEQNGPAGGVLAKLGRRCRQKSRAKRDPNKGINRKMVRERRCRVNAGGLVLPACAPRPCALTRPQRDRHQVRSAAGRNCNGNIRMVGFTSFSKRERDSAGWCPRRGLISGPEPATSDAWGCSLCRSDCSRVKLAIGVTIDIGRPGY
jgi:hypothetical protein